MNEITIAIIGGTAAVCFSLGFWTAALLKRGETERAVAAAKNTEWDFYKNDVAKLTAQHAHELAETRRAHSHEIEQQARAAASALDHLQTTHDTDKQVMRNRHSLDLADAIQRAYQEGKESDGMYRGNDGSGQMVSVKKAKEKAAAASTPVAPLTKEEKDALSRKMKQLRASKTAATKQAGAKCNTTPKAKPQPKPKSSKAPTKAPKTASL